MKKILSVLLILAVMCFSLPARAGDITATGMNQGDVYNLLNNLTRHSLYRTYTLAGVTVGSTVARIQSTTIITYSVGGILYEKKIFDSPALTAAVQAVSTYCIYLLSLNDVGTVEVTKGRAVSTDTAQYPKAPATGATFGAIKVQTNASTTFTLGTTSLNDSGLTVTFYNLGTIPSGPSRIGMTGW